MALIVSDVVLDGLWEYIFLYFAGYLQIPKPQNLNKNTRVQKGIFVP